MQDKLINLAQKTMERAWAPYSGFRVGAALLSTDGAVFCGCNVESSTFGATVCAERAALCAAVAQGKREFSMLAIYTDTDEPVTPCGICRQILHDFSPEMTIVCAARARKTLTRTLKDLLPDAFGASQIKK